MPIVAGRARKARLSDVRDIAMAMPFVTEEPGSQGKPIYQLGGRSFIFFRNPRPDALDPETGERIPDVIVFWTRSEGDKQALLQDDALPFFTTDHFDNHPSVLLRASRVHELSLDKLTEIVQEAWLARASNKRATDWLAAQGLEHN